MIELADDVAPPATGSAGDISFVAQRSPRRERFLAGAASQLWPLRTRLELTIGPPAQAGRAPARVVLDVGRDGPGPLDVELVRLAIAAGAVVVTDAPEVPAPLVPGEHLIVAPFDYLAEQAVALALDEPRRAGLAAAARDLHVPDPAPRSTAARPRRSIARRLRRALGPDPAAAQAEVEQLGRVVADLKAAYVAQVDLRRHLEAARSDDPSVTSTPAWDTSAASVSVVVPMHRDIDAVLASIVAQGDVEAVVVGAGAAAAIASTPRLVATAIEPARPLGPGEVADAGVGAARTELLVVLEPGEQLYPNAVTALCDALDDDAAGAYGITELTDASASVGVQGHLRWDVDVLVRERAHDAIALIRRDALGAAPTQALLDGWQRHDRLLAIAERGGRLQPTGAVVGRRPLGDGRLDRIDPRRTWLTLFERHPRLPWPS